MALLLGRAARGLSFGVDAAEPLALLGAAVVLEPSCSAPRTFPLGARGASIRWSRTAAMAVRASAETSALDSLEFAMRSITTRHEGNCLRIGAHAALAKSPLRSL